MIVLALAGPALAEPTERIPVEHVYATHGGVELKAYVFEPDASVARPCPAGVVDHGGGWVMGEASWGFGSAKRYASIGLVGISVQYRLSDQRSITPLDAMEDIRAAIRWARSNAADLRVDPKRIAGFGWSAGAHLLAASAIFPGDGTVSAAPDALLLKSPAVVLESDGWMKRILLGRAEAREISPADHVRSGLPPLIIVQGKTDTVTPTDGVQRFCEAMRSVRPDMVFGADLIAGFPTETETMFRNSLSLVDECGLTFLHVFPFSAREGTPAARMPQVNGRTIARRASELRDKGVAALKSHLAAAKGCRIQVLMESPGHGRSTDFTPVRLDAHTGAGALVDAVVAGDDGSALLATVTS